ncbi:hypothetical protein CPB86DRAFT_712672 [Serendipita vermifera]|nr:hypothetical protein CPB86DRAFT_712672 [Serendipita vermifera]
MVECSHDRLPSTLVVKFCRKYPKEVHLLCSKLEIAPKLYGFQPLPGGWYMVIMEYMADYTPLSDVEAPSPLTNQQIRTAMQVMHEAGIAHGDLRPSNILVSKDLSIGRHIVFVDWDWSGEAGKVTYPVSINPLLPRHPSVEGGLPILVEHDEVMVRSLKEDGLLKERRDLHRKWFKRLDHFRMEESSIKL